MQRCSSLRWKARQRASEILEGFKHAQGFLRSELAHRIGLRSFPRLRFHWDATAERAENIERILASLQDESPAATAR